MADGSAQGPGQLAVAAACDGACSGNPGPGGWGALLRFADGSVQEMGGADAATTNNRMEITAALALLGALKALPRHPELVIRTDSRYLIDGLQKWLPGWKRKGWRTASGGPVLNRDLWEQLERSRISGLSLVHVRGHSGDPDNDRCDAIAVAFSRGQQPRLQRRGDGPALAQAPAAMPAAVAGPAPGQAECSDPAPAALNHLLERVELADRLAQGGYGLSLVELAQLVELPLRQLESRSGAWIWRDWLVQPLADGRWRLERGAGGLAQPE
jgi:ribonuclease HI